MPSNHLTGSLFPDSGPVFKPAKGDLRNAPLAERMRPATLDEFVGQTHLLGPGRVLRRIVEEDKLSSMVFWGPPGSGKTTLARIITAHTAAEFVPFSAVTSGIKEIREVMFSAQKALSATGRRTVLFIDEIHRFNRAQQDAFLPHVERGTIILIGATTENPSFEINSALLSRLKVFVLNQLTADEIETILKRALSDETRGLGNLKVEVPPQLLAELASESGGDARVALNTLELAVATARPDENGTRRLVPDDLREALQRAVALYDKAGEQHFNLISAFIKSLRNSDADATLYWLARMIEGGEDPMYIARRIVHHASEDIGLADPQALVVAVAAAQATHLIGFPEARVALAEAAVYLAKAPKSNRVMEAYEAAAADARATPTEPVPLHLRNAPTPLMKKFGYGKGYKYAHDYEEGVADMVCLPEKLKGKKYL